MGNAVPISRDRGLALAGLALFAIVLVRNAWLSDDALITLRCIENWLSGNGLRFNVVERVQAYTHPLWLALLTPFYALSREAFYTAILLSIALSLAALAVVVASVRDGRRAMASLLCLASSKAFVDYTSSGLENALLYLLIALFAMWYLDEPAHPIGRGRFRALAAVAAAIALTRLDAMLLVVPACVELVVRTVREHRDARHWLVDGLVGAAPLVAWLAFALVYYGTPLPNTAYSKLDTGIPLEARVLQGLTYLRSSLVYDPITLVLLVAGVVAAAIGPRRRLVPLALGGVFYVAYTISIGGDFMAGRFLSAPLLLAVLVLSASRVPWPVYVGLGAIALGISLTSPLAPVRSGSDYMNHDPALVRRLGGVADERGFYYPVRGLLAANREAPLYAGSQCVDDEPRVEVRRDCGGLGIAGFKACADTHLVDPCALTDPLLSRMAVSSRRRWRVGHYRRPIPPGYVASLESDRNEISDPRWRALYDDVVLVTREPLFASGRWRAVVRLNFHDYAADGAGAVE